MDFTEHTSLSQQVRRLVDKYSLHLEQLPNYDSVSYIFAIRRLRWPVATCQVLISRLRELMALEAAAYEKIMNKYNEMTPTEKQAVEENKQQAVRNHQDVIGAHDTLTGFSLKKEQAEADLKHYQALKKGHPVQRLPAWGPPPTVALQNPPAVVGNGQMIAPGAPSTQETLEKLAKTVSDLQTEIEDLKKTKVKQGAQEEEAGPSSKKKTRRD